MTSKRNSRVYTAEQSGYPVDSGSSTTSTTSNSSYRSRRSSRSSSSQEDVVQGTEMEDDQQNLKKDDDIPSSKERENSLAAIQRANKAHVLSLDATFPTEYPEAPMMGRPVNFGIVVPGIYRSSYPQREDYAYLETLKLKTLVTLVVKEEGDRELTSFVTANGINHILVPMRGTKKEAIPDVTMKGILNHVLDRRNYPLLVHCNQGKHRTGCVVGVMRKLAGWDVGRTVDEYRSYAEPKIREVDVEYISAFEASSLGLVGHQQLRGTPTPAQRRARMRALYLAFGLWAILCLTFQLLYEPPTS